MVLVEGEKCVDALMQVGIVATTAMGGAATALEKTDWSPLAGKTVIVWPDNDEAGARYAKALIPKLLSIGAKVERISVPDDKPPKWDAADAVAEGVDVHALLAGAMPITSAQPHQPFEITQWRARERFTGEPQPRRWLVEGVFSLAQAALVAAAGGVGKSFLLLALAREVAASTVRVQTEVCRVCGLHPPAVTGSKGEQGNSESNGAMAAAVTPFPVRSEDHSASDRYYLHLIASRNHIGKIEACAQ